LRSEVFRVVTLSSKVTESECSFKTSSINNAVTQHSSPADLNSVVIYMMMMMIIIIIIRRRRRRRRRRKEQRSSDSTEENGNRNKETQDGPFQSPSHIGNGQENGKKLNK